jgi:Domain of unknown function (DUF4105)
MVLVAAQRTSDRLKARLRDRGRSAACFALPCCLVASAQVRAQDYPLRDATQLSVVTFGRGDRVNQYFGHNAFIVSGPHLAAPLVINYGMFSFGPGMIAHFLRGRLHFWVGVTDLERTNDYYAAAGRDVRVRDLQLEPAALARVLDQLERDLKPANRVYLYDH